MKTLHALWIFTLLAYSVCSHAADAPYVTEPQLAIALPLVQRGGNVGLDFPILINPNVAVPTNATLRVIYIQPRGDDQAIRKIRRKSDQEVAYSRKTGLEPTHEPIPIAQQAAQLIARETIWPKVGNFQLALTQLTSNDLHFVYWDPKTSTLVDEPIQFPDGLILGEKPQGVTVLAVEKGSAAAKAGIVAGDILLQWGQTSIDGRLANFTTAYYEARKQASLSTTDTLSVQVQRAGSSAPLTLQLRKPISLNASLLDLPAESSQKPDKPAVPWN